MKHQYFRDDLVVAHKFHNKNGDSQEQIPVPHHVRLCFFTAPEAGVICVERNGDICNGCSVTADGMILSASVSLSRTCIGKGPLMCLVQEFRDDPAFPQGVMINSMPALLDVVLGDNKSDDAGEVSSDVTFGELSRILDDFKALNSKVEQQDGSIFDLYDRISGLDERADNAVDLNTEQTITASKKFTVAPIMQAGLSMAGSRIRKLATPVNNDDAANKSYVDTTVAKIPVEAGDGTLAIKTRGVSHDASGNGSVAVGIHKNIASGENSHAEGKETKAYSKGSHAEGYQTVAGDEHDPTTEHNYSHSEGHTTQAIGKYSHSEGYGSVANGNASHAEGYNTVTNNRAELAIGHFNKSNKGTDTYGNANNTIFSIGIGASDNARKNAVEVMQNGDVYVIGVGNYQGDNPASAVALANFLKSLNGKFGDLISRYDMDMEYLSFQMSDITDLVMGAQQALVYKDYNALIAYLNSNPNGDVMHKGQSIYIQQLDVPDLWVSGNRAPDNLTEYMYTNDADFLEYIKAGGWIGCHQLSLLETAKVNLDDYVRNSEVVRAINPKLGGVVCLELGNDKPDNFDEIMSILQRALQEKVHYIISVYDKELGRYLGEPETIMNDGESYIIQQNRFTSDVILISYTYRFYNNGTYLRTQKSYDFSQVLNRLDAIENKLNETS